MDCDELYVSLLFPPSDYVSGINVFKRIVNNKRPVDVLQINQDSSDTIFDNYINERITLDMECEIDTPSCILNSLKGALELIEKDYNRIYSRSWVMNNHFIALEYKLAHPDVSWTAEFSDPVILNLSNKPRRSDGFTLDDIDYVNHINYYIVELNSKNNTSFPLIENKSSFFVITEYLAYLFADEIIFTNENQREVMLNQFSRDVKEWVLDKSIIQMHATLDEEFYHIKDAELDLDNEKVNIAYFGRDYYGQRHFESLFYSIESLNHKFKDRIRIHLFIEDVKILKKLIRPLESSDNFIVKRPLEYFDFLNATTKFDVLVVNDVVTMNDWPINPYLPSKLSDYLGSSSDIWALYEPGSTLSECDLRYKSDITDFSACQKQLIKILEDRGFVDEEYSVDESYFLERLTVLNRLYEREFNRGLKRKMENKSLKKINDEILSSNSWKLTSVFRRVRK